MGAKSRSRPPKGNIVTGPLKARSLAVLTALAMLAALASLVSSVLTFSLPNFHSYYCLLDSASGGLWGPNRVTGHLKATVIGHLKAISLDVLAALASLVSNVLIFALHNFHPYYCLLDFASGGLWGPNRVIRHLKATSL